jgi:integrase
MANHAGGLTIKEIEKLVRDTKAGLLKPGYHSDGAVPGLSLQISKTGAASWVFRFTDPNKQLDKPRTREKGLGTLGLASLNRTGVGPAEARDKAREARRLRLAGIDPIEHEKQAQMQQSLQAANTKTFEYCGEQFIETFKSGWRGYYTVNQYRNALRDHVYPIIGKIPMRHITTAHIRDVLAPLWTSKSPMAKLLQTLISRIFGWAKSLEYCDSNPAAWKGCLEWVLPKPADVHQPKHRVAMDYRLVPAFMAELRKFEHPALVALRLTILNTARKREVAGLPWAEIDFENAIWEIPASRHKAGKKTGRPLRRPLAPVSLEILRQLDALRLQPRQSRQSPKRDAVIAALADSDGQTSAHAIASQCNCAVGYVEFLLRMLRKPPRPRQSPMRDAVIAALADPDGETSMRAIANQCGCSDSYVKLISRERRKTSQDPLQRSGFVFPGESKTVDGDCCINPITINKTVDKLIRPRCLEFGYFEIHGFRSSFSTWAEETTSFPSALRKLALGHVAEDAIDRSYQRSDLLERRRELADAWENYCEGTSGGVIALSERRRSKA